MNKLTIPTIKQPLPGRLAQFKMSHVVRRKEQIIPENARIACTLVLLYPKKEEWHLVLIQRTSHNPNDRHGGQISFPGGQQEENDASLSATAIREAQEEIGADPSKITLLGGLTDLYIPVSNFKVYPFVAYTNERPNFELQESEVQAIIEVPLSVLQDEKTRQLTNIKISERITLKEVPYFNVGGKVVWGATAMMLSEFLEAIHE